MKDPLFVSSGNIDLFDRYRTTVALVRIMSFYEVNLKSVL